MTLVSLHLGTDQGLQTNVSNAALTNDSSSHLKSDQPLHERIVVSIVIIIIALAGTMGNLITLVTIAKVKELRKQSTHLFIANLAIADLLLLLIGTPTIVTSMIRNEWLFGQDICNLVAIALSTTSTVSLVQIMVIAINRYCVIVDAKIAPRVFKGWKNGAIILGIWTFMTFSQVMPALGVYEDTFYTYSPRVYQCLLRLPPGKLTHVSYTVMVFYFMIQLAILTCYSLITVKVRNSRKRIHTHYNSGNQQTENT
ncbi:melatonin receptor type 1B-like, partial [Lingula anatina]|uniref:Melatonin receptor type 1B-like n=1 Tax=Lingula anatina TaxID=7574 RepID=A0A2R2MND4_LINAN